MRDPKDTERCEEAANGKNSQDNKAMWPDGSQGDGEVRRNDIACYTCRRRKVRCDREFPRCQVCEQTGQLCDYPPRPMKPGPKIGSSQRLKRQRRERQRTGKQQMSQRSFSPCASNDDGHGSCEIDRAEEHSSPIVVSADDGDAPRRNSELNIKDLSFILHPCHEASTPEKEAKDQSPGRESNDHASPIMIQQACASLGVSSDMMEEMIRLYFRNMVAINLFHEPSFPAKLTGIPSTVQICALLASILAYAARFYPLEAHFVSENRMSPMQASCPPPEHFLSMALKLIDNAIVECDDEPPPICVLQALILATHCQLTRGVHGKAWRSLGMCVRLAYELNLHLIDPRGITGAGQVDPVRWREDEERRRAWWAIWEMDVFASTIRRTPTAVDWAHLETLLPIDDADWFSDRPVPSAYLERDPIQRWKSIQDAGNRSPKAWFLVINSLMRDAQVISSPHGVLLESNPAQRQMPGSIMCKSKNPCHSSAEDARQQLEILANAVQCFTLALPPHLRYRNQYLGFEPPVDGQVTSSRQLHCGIYNIFVMTQLARLMIHRYDIFRQPAAAGQYRRNDGTGIAQSQSLGFQDLENTSERQCFEAADNILSIVNRSCEEHIQHINPFLLSTIWLASAVQLVRKYLGRSSTNSSLIKSRFDVLYLTYKRCVTFWDAKTALQRNLETLEAQLESHFQSQRCEPPRTSRDISNQFLDQRQGPYSSWIPDKPNTGTSGLETMAPPADATRGPVLVERSSSSVCNGKQDSGSQATTSRNRRPSTDVEENLQTSDNAIQNSVPVCMAGRQEQQSRQTPEQPRCGRSYFKLPLPPTPPSSTAAPESVGGSHHSLLDFMHMPPPDTSPELFDPGTVSMTLEDTRQHDLDWRSIGLPVDFQDLLSGLSSY